MFVRPYTGIMNSYERISINLSLAIPNLQIFNMQLFIFAHKLGNHLIKTTAFAIR